MTKTINLLLFILVLCHSLNAQKSTSLSLDQAIELGVSNSKVLKIDDSKIMQAEAQLLEAKNYKLPNLGFSGTALGLTTPIIKMEGNNQNDLAINSLFFGNLSASYPIYTGGKIKYGIQSAEYLLKANKIMKDGSEQEIAMNVAESYNNLLKARQAIEVIEKHLEAAQKRDSIFMDLENNGILSRNDRLKANLQTTGLNLQLLEAKNNYNLANLNMAIMLGLDENTEIKLDDGYLSNEKEDLDIQEIRNEAARNRSELKVLEAQRNSIEIHKKVANAENYPTVALTAGYVAANIPNFLTITNAANIGINVNYNLDHYWKKNTALMKLEAQSLELESNDQLLRDKINLELSRDFNNYKLSKSKINLHEKALAQANENYNITLDKFNNGLETAANLLEADAMKLNAEVSLYQSKADAALALIKLKYSMGILR